MANNIITENLSDYVKGSGIKITFLSQHTGIPYRALLKSLGDVARPLRADEFLKICKVLNKDPWEFACDRPGAKGELHGSI